MESPGELNPDGDVTIENGAEKTFKWEEEMIIILVW